MKIGDKLEASDHANITFNIVCDLQRSEPQYVRPNLYYRAVTLQRIAPTYADV